MAGLKKITIALATYNGAKYLQGLLASLESQTLQPAKLIIVDDCSTDNTLQIIKAFKPRQFAVQVYENKINLGVTKTFKKLVSLCGSSYIAFCDQDDIWLPQKLEESYRALRQIDDDKTPAVVFSNLSLIDAGNNVLHKSFWQVYGISIPRTTFKTILFGNAVTGCTTLLNGAMAAEVLAMPDDVIMYDHWMALIAFSIGKFKAMDVPLVLYRSHQESVTTKNKPSALHNLLAEASESKAYLAPQIKQAKLFSAQFSSKLPAKIQAQLSRFIALQNKSFIYKKLTRVIVAKVTG